MKIGLKFTDSKQNIQKLRYIRMDQIEIAILRTTETSCKNYYYYSHVMIDI